MDVKPKDERPKELWRTGDAYERYVGRWSRLVGREFLAWLSIPSRASWVDVGCGTGALVDGILRTSDPSQVTGIDRSAGFVTAARRTITDARVRFEVGDTLALPLVTGTSDITVSGLVLNFVPDHAAMVREMVRVTKPGGKVAAYVWDYAGGMQMMRYFWDAAITISPQAAELDQGERFPLCRPEPLCALFQEVGLTSVSARAIDIATVFQDFADFWTPFLGKQGSAPTYLASLDEETREQIRQLLQARLAPQSSGVIALSARAWTVQGMV